jgi:oligoendopeptidase F
MTNTATETIAPAALPKRHEVPVELTWNLDVIYTDDAAWENDFTRIENQCAEFANLAGTLSESSQKLLHVLKQRDELGIALSQLYSYASLRRSENNADADAQAKADRANMLYTKYSSATAWVEPEILALPSSQVRDFLEAESGLQTYRYYLETLERRRPHVRSSEVEEVLAQAGEAMHATGTVFKLFNNADLKFPSIHDDEGREVELSHGRYLSFLENRNRQVREDAFRTMHGAYFNWRNTLAANLAGTVKAHVFNARVRGYQSALHASMESNDIPVPVYGNLVSTVRERLPVLHRYLRLRKKLLGLDELQLWDLYVPMVADVEKPVTIQEAQNLVIESSQPLGENYVSILKGGFEARWVDWVENEGKTSGAFSDGAYTTPPYILMNWQDDLNRTFTLAHEFGHSLHSYFTRGKQPFIYADYTMFVAEVASTLNEALLTHHLVKQAQAEGDKALELSLLNHYAEGFRTTLYRQTLFAEFELRIHNMVEAGEALTAEALCALYKSINDDYYGAEVTVDECVAIEWARIPHFYYNFYVYQYSTGISAATALSAQILEEGAPAVERYLEFLRGGSSDTSINLLRGAGIDMATPQPIHQALDEFDRIIARMEELAA